MKKSCKGWSDCNIYPNYKIYKQVIKEDDQVISVHDTNIINGRLNNIKNLFEIYKNEKIGIKPGDYFINISYWSNENYGNPNILWKKAGQEISISQQTINFLTKIFFLF